MSLLAALVGAFFKSLFGAIGSWLSGQQVRADDQSLGQKSQQTADDQAAIKTQAAEAQAQADAPKTVIAVEGELDAGKF